MRTPHQSLDYDDSSCTFDGTIVYTRTTCESHFHSYSNPLPLVSHPPPFLSVWWRSATRKVSPVHRTRRRGPMNSTLPEISGGVGGLFFSLRTVNPGIMWRVQARHNLRISKRGTQAPISLPYTR